MALGGRLDTALSDRAFRIFGWGFALFIAGTIFVWFLSMELEGRFIAAAEQIKVGEHESDVFKRLGGPPHYRCPGDDAAWVLEYVSGNARKTTEVPVCPRRQFNTLVGLDKDLKVVWVVPVFGAPTGIPGTPWTPLWVLLMMVGVFGTLLAATYYLNRPPARSSRP